MQRRGVTGATGTSGVVIPDGTEVLPGCSPISSKFCDIYAVVACIPSGRVATYGQVALLAGLPGRARMVGQALSALTEQGIPWHRVINARGEISSRADGDPGADLQRLRLESEGVLFDRHGRISLQHYQWRPVVLDAAPDSNG
jgi:methylated-DNA-protein-cysteine methyltransferase-like protein